MKKGIAGLVEVAVLVFGATFLGSPALAKCGKDCKSLITSEFKTCKTGCGTDKVCKKACSDEKKADAAACKAATNPTPPDCGETTTTTTTTTTASSTTTTLVPGICGNGVLNTGEDCDLPAYVPEACVTDTFFEVTCEPPGSANECRCCPGRCVLPPPTFCCPGRRCVDVTGAGSFRGGICVADACVSAADCCQPGTDCGAFDCAGGTCCARAGGFCSGIDCCPGAICQDSGNIRRCCLPAGTACGANAECCSSSCNATTSMCD